MGEIYNVVIPRKGKGKEHTELKEIDTLNSISEMEGKAFDKFE